MNTINIKNSNFNEIYSVKSNNTHSVCTFAKEEETIEESRLKRLRTKCLNDIITNLNAKIDNDTSQLSVEDIHKYYPVHK